MRDYEGKLGIGQIIFCVIALATLFVPYSVSTNSSAISSLSEISTAQSTYLTAFTQSLASSITIPSGISVLIYIFYAIVLITLTFTILMIFLKNEPIRQILRILSILTGFLMIAILIVTLLTIAGFFIYYMNGNFGDALIVDCIKDNGLFFFLALAVISAIAMVKHFSSFFGKSY